MQPHEREFFDIDSSCAALVIIKGEKPYYKKRYIILNLLVKRTSNDLQDWHILVVKLTTFAFLV